MLPMINTEYIDYSKWKGWVPSNFGFCDLESTLYYSRECRLAGFESLKDINILEIGFGVGNFARWCNDNGANYRGTEVIQELVVAGREKGFMTFDANLPLEKILQNDMVDLVVAFDVFEHLDIVDLKLLLGTIRNFLSSKGILLFRTPSGDSPFSRAIQHGDLTHRLTLGSSAIHQLCCELGYEVLAIKEPASPIIGLGWSRLFRRLIIKTIRFLSYPIIQNIFMDGKKSVLSSHMVCILKKKVA